MSRIAAAVFCSVLAACGAPTSPPPAPPATFLDRAIPSVGPVTVVAIGGEPFVRKVLAASLVGIVNQTEVRLFLVDGQPDPLNRWWETTGEERSQRFWLDHYATQYGLVRAGEVDLDAALVAHARDAAGFVVVSDAEPWTINAATTRAGLDRLLVATAADAPLLEALGLPLVEDLRGRWTDVDACNRDTFLALYPRATLLAVGVVTPTEYRIRDFLIQNRVFTFYGRPDAEGWTSAQEILQATPHDEPVIGYFATTIAEELSADYAIATAGKYLIPSDTTPNLSVHSAIVATLPTPRPVNPAASCGTGTLRVTIAITDGDNLSVPINRYIADAYWLAADRGTFPIGWSLAPELARLAPAVAAYYAATRSPDDELVGMFGVGYVFPTELPDPGPYFQQSFPLLAALGMTTDWHIDPNLYIDPMAPVWSDLSAHFGTAPGDIRGVLLGYIGSAGIRPFRTAAGMPVLTAQNIYDDTPVALEQRIRDALSAMLAGTGPDTLFLSAAVWNNDFAGLVQVFRDLQAEPRVTFFSPAQLLECLATP